MTYSLHLDFETRSTIDLTAVGAHVYAKHPSTRVLCASYATQGKVQRWRPWAGESLDGDLKRMLADPDCLIEAWNANFERLILRHVVGVELPIERFRCTMARARSMALPGQLGLCAKALRMPVQKADNTVMMSWCKPLPDGSWAQDPAEYEELCAYCDVDVLTEMGLAALLRDLSPEEWHDYHINEAVNDRGIPVDIALAKAAQHYAKDELHEICQRLNVVTKGVVTSPKQFARIKKWLGENLPPELQEFVAPDDRGKVSLDAAAREDMLGEENEDVLVGDVRELVELVHDGGRASTAKFAAMVVRADPDDQRVRGAYVFNGAGQTGRYSSTGLQVHNYIRATLDNIEDVVEAILKRVPKKQLQDIASYQSDGSFVFDKSRDAPIDQPYNVLTVLSRTLRPSIVAEDGKCLVWGDWSSIEAVVNPWLSRENSASELLDYFARGGDLYIRQAVMTYGLEREDLVSKAQRQAGGKVPVLSFGFGGGANAALRMARAYNVSMDRDTADMLKLTWRRSNPWAERFWRALEVAAYNAIRQPDTVQHAGRVAYLFAQSMLWCLLPSGRLLCYPFARVDVIDGRFGPQEVVTAIKGAFHPKKDSSHWPRMKLWGGIQCENVTQAEAASMLRWCVRELVDNGWPVIGHTHDEPLLEVGDSEIEEAKVVLHEIMTSGPAWAAGLPLRAEVSAGFVYGK
jgi:DNA polymerase bacteriophage-type